MPSEMKPNETSQAHETHKKETHVFIILDGKRQRGETEDSYGRELHVFDDISLQKGTEGNVI